MDVSFAISKKGAAIFVVLFYKIHFSIKFIRLS